MRGHLEFQPHLPNLEGNGYRVLADDAGVNVFIGAIVWHPKLRAFVFRVNGNRLLSERWLTELRDEIARLTHERRHGLRAIG